jgi:uncharacterized protein YbcC (UPF0753/DUF2309 family)
MANRPEVRSLLKESGIEIPDTTHFLGGYHDTSSDSITYFDSDSIPTGLTDLFEELRFLVDEARRRNARERCRRFPLAPHHDRDAALAHVEGRAQSIAEPRPEYGHATNSLAIIAPRDRSRGVFFDRRAFLNSYDYRKDTEGKALAKILGAAAPVCGGINLEYYFSRMDPDKLGAGTKLPHNVMGLIGVANGADGDLRTGLPYQMVEIHDPIRLIMIVEQYPNLVMEVLKSNPATYEWVKNYWVHFVVIDPESRQMLRFKDESFVVYTPESKIDHLEHLKDKLLSTKENLPVYLIDSI